jgi:signal transduction histidine kinase
MERTTDVNILLVDDNPGKLLALDAALSPLGLTIVKANSGREALRCLLQQDFAAVLLDVHMPGMDGFETAELIRARERSAHTPILFISAISQTDDHASRGYTLGAVDYIFAPALPHILRAKVSVFVELFRQTREARRQAATVAERTGELEASYDRLRLAERMASLGTLSAGLGHDMGNLLLPIQVRLEALEQRGMPPEGIEDLRAIRQCTAYLQRLANGLRLLALDPGDARADESTPLAEWWADTSPLLKNVLPRGVTLAGEIPEGLAPVGLARSALTQAVLNLVQNAGDVLRERGKGNVRVWARAERGGAGERVELGVSDDGPGMTEEVKRRCMEPFFTTKTRKISTGLGLALVHGAVQQCGGTVRVDSEPGRGTSIVLNLPLERVPPTSGERPLAVVSLRNNRMKTFVGSILESLEFRVETGERPENGSASLWITEPRSGTADAARAFVDGAEHRRVVLFGAGPKGGDGVGERIVALGGSPAPARIREALKNAASACASTTAVSTPQEVTHA